MGTIGYSFVVVIIGYMYGYLHAKSRDRVSIDFVIMGIIVYTIAKKMLRFRFAW